MPKILDVIEMGLAALRSKIGPLATEIEDAIVAALAPAKAQESVVEAEIAHLTSIGYIVSKVPPAAPAAPDVPVDPPVDVPADATVVDAATDPAPSA